jgi:hypothetical protein
MIFEPSDLPFYYWPVATSIIGLYLVSNGLSLFPNPPASITPFTLKYTPFNQLNAMLKLILYLQKDSLAHECKYWRQ